MKKLLYTALAAILALCLLAGCAATAGSAISTDTLTIVTTIFPHYDFARAVCGNSANITMLLRPGAESHSFDPSPADAMAIQNADVFIYTGGHGDAWVETILQSAKTDGMVVLRMMDYVQTVEEENFLEASHEEHAQSAETIRHTDEHIWTSPKNAVVMVSAIANALQQAGYDTNGNFEKNAQEYIAKLENLDATFRDIVATAQRSTIVVGDRFPFQYFTNEYGLTYHAAFPGCSTDSNPSAGQVANLIDIVRQQQLPYIYTIELSTGSVARVISEETGCGILTLESCHTLTQQQFEAGETYISLMEKNAENLQKGLN